MGQQPGGTSRNGDNTMQSWRLESLNRHRPVFALVLALLSPIALSQKSTGGNATQVAQKVTVPESDPLASDECQLARSELDTALNAAAKNRHDKAAQLAQARQRMALACLGPASSSQAATRSRQTPLVVPPIVPAAPTPPVVVPPPALTVPRTSIITACDAGGCWDSDGARLQRSGPNLMGPRGPCTAQGALFNCP